VARGWETSVQRTLGRDVSVGPHGLSVFIPCKGPCAQVVQFHTPKVMSPEGLRRKLETDGWTLARVRQCPACNAAKSQTKENTPVAIEQPKLAVVATPPATTAAPMSPTDAARAMRRAVLQWLDEAYDVARSAYRTGITDATIATETGAAPALVKQMREENYGPLLVPTEIAELVEELAAIRREASEARDGLDVKLSGLNGRAMAAEQKLARLAQKNGWTL
jgi:hypothetical protein